MKQTKDSFEIKIKIIHKAQFTKKTKKQKQKKQNNKQQKFYKLYVLFNFQHMIERKVVLII